MVKSVNFVCLISMQGPGNIDHLGSYAAIGGERSVWLGNSKRGEGAGRKILGR